MFLTNVLLKKTKSKLVMVLMESVVSGHKFNYIRERLADKVELIRFDPYSIHNICDQYVAAALNKFGLWQPITSPPRPTGLPSICWPSVGWQTQTYPQRQHSPFREICNKTKLRQCSTRITVQGKKENKKYEE